MNYVLGFCFSEYPLTPGVFYVALIRKVNPEWQRGKLNGIGGKVGVEIGGTEKTFEETDHAAMVREFKEETGKKTPEDVWIHFADLMIPDGKVACFTCSVDWETFNDLRSPDKADEEVDLIRMDRVHEYNPLYNLSWLVPMAKCFLKNATQPFLKIEEQEFPACGW